MHATIRALLVLLILLVAGLPAMPARAAAAPSIENLINGSFEGTASRANGYVTDGDGAAPGAVARTGQQSVELARAGATPQPSLVLGRVRAYPVSSVPLPLVTSVAFASRMPVAPPATRTIALQLVLEISTSGNGVADDCFVTTVAPAPGAGWTLHDLGPSASYHTGGASCAPSGAARALSALQADPAYANATILDVWIQSVVDSASPWPPGASLFVDDATVLAPHSDRVRIRDAADNLCGGASFADLPSALACAASGATLLLAPVAFTGPLTLTSPVTICGTNAAGDADCAPGSTGATINGDGVNPRVVEIAAPDVTLRGMIIQNGNYAGAADAILVDVHADRARLQENLVVSPAAAPAAGSSRAQNVGILVRGDARDVRLERNAVFSFPNPAGVGASCACRSVGILDAASSGLKLVANTVNLAGSGPSVGILVSSNDTDVEPNSITIDGASTGILALPGTSPTILGNGIGLGSGSATGSTGIWLQTPTASLSLNDLEGLATGVKLDPAGSPMVSNFFGRNTVDVLVASGSGAQLLDQQHTDGRSTAISILAPAHDLAIDARNGSWGVFSRAAIRALMSDAGARDAIDFSCYFDSDGAMRICPPTAAFTAAPSSPTWNRSVAFTDASVPHGRALASWAWDFGDGAAASTKDAAHVYAAPGVFRVTLTVTDADGWTAASAIMLPVADTAPAFDAVPDPTIGENESLRVRVHARDAENDPITYSATGLPAGAAFDAATATLDWRPGFDQEGAYDVVVHASDGALESTRTLHVTVQHRNAPPQLSILGSTRTAEGQQFTLNVSATDLDGDAISTSASPLMLGMAYADHHDGTGTFSWTPGPTDSGDYPVSFQASDGANVTTVQVTIHVADTNRPPYLSSPTTLQTLHEGTSTLITLLCADPDGDPCTIQAAQLPFGAHYDADRALFDWTPSYTQAGWYNASFRISDGKTTVMVPLAMRVLNTDRPPHIAAIANQSTLTARSLTIALSGSDPDGDPISFSSPDAPVGVTITSGGLSYRPPLGAEGFYQFHVVASDGTLTDTTTINVTVGANHPPVIALSGPTRVHVFERFALSAYGSFDPDGSPLRYSWDLNASDGIGSDAATMNLTASFPTLVNHTVTLTVTDADGLSSTATLPITVDDALFASIFVQHGARNTDPTVVQVTVKDWRGRPVQGAHVDVRKFYQPAAATGPLFEQTASGGTGPTGIAFFRFAAETPAGDAPGNHFAIATATLDHSYLGDTETVTVQSAYSGVIL